MGMGISGYGKLGVLVTEMHLPRAYQTAPSSPSNQWQIPILPLPRHQTPRALHPFPRRQPPLDYSYATTLFHHLHNPSTNQWNAVVRGLAQSPQPTQAIAWYRNMSQASQKVDALRCSFVLKACASALAFTEAMQIHSQIVQFGFGADVLLRITLLDVYAKVGDGVCTEGKLVSSNGCDDGDLFQSELSSFRVVFKPLSPFGKGMMKSRFSVRSPPVRNWVHSKEEKKYMPV
ncbi:hypothetical protein ACFX15_033587 [Malus domestica]